MATVAHLVRWWYTAVDVAASCIANKFMLGAIYLKLLTNFIQSNEELSNVGILMYGNCFNSHVKVIS